MPLRTPSHLYRQHLYRKLLRRVPADRFLDVGFGAGDTAIYLASRGGKGVALDFSSEAAALGRERLARFQNLEVVESDFLAYEPRHRFVLITLLEILEHVENDRAFLEKAVNLLRPGGRVLISVPAHSALRDWRDEVKGHLRRYERAALKDLIAGAGLKTEALWCWGWPFITALRRVTRKPLLSGEPAREERTRASALRSEMKPWMAPFVNRVTAFIPFLIMDLFLESDLGVGYIGLAERAA